MKFHLLTLVLLLKLASISARPMSATSGRLRASFDLSSPTIVGGVDAEVGEFPWQLSQQRLSTEWTHSCGASLLTHTYALSAAHCVDGASPSILRVWAGLHELNDTSVGEMAEITDYKIHENYGQMPGTHSNDIAILTLGNPINENGITIMFLTLPVDDTDDFAGATCTMSGWGRTSESNTVSWVLQKADIDVITTDYCNELMSTVPGILVLDSMICVYDEFQLTGSCNGDSGGPLNCNNNGTVVAGVNSWIISESGNCLQSYPSVFTRTSSFLDWIAINITP